MLHCLTLCKEDSQSASRRLNRREIASISMHNEVRPAAGLEWGCITLLPQMNFSRVHLEPWKPRPPPLGSRSRADLVITVFAQGPKEEENKPPSSSVKCRCDSITKVEKYDQRKRQDTGLAVGHPTEILQTISILYIWYRDMHRTLPSMPVFILEWNEIFSLSCFVWVPTTSSLFWSELLTQGRICAEKNCLRDKLQSKGIPPSGKAFSDVEATPCVSQWQHPWPMTVCDI